MPKLKLLAGTFLTALFLLPALSSAQTISIVSGNGQLVCPDCVGSQEIYAPLVVQVNDSSGKALANTNVTWTATQYGYAPVASVSLTNSLGQATCTPGKSGCAFTPFAFFFGSSFLPATVVASAVTPATAVTFVETTTEPTLSGSGEGTPPVSINLVPASSAPPLSGLSGQTDPKSIVVSVSGSFAPLSGIQVRLQSAASGPTVSCATQPGQQAGTVLTDSTGTATCKPVFGAGVGTGSYTIWVGDNYAFFGPAALTVTVGPPAIFKVISGNNQTVNSGAKAPLALTAQVTDLGGNPLGGVPVKWTVTAGTATLSQVVTTTLTSGAALGEVSAAVTPTAGPVTVTVSVVANPALQAVFTVIVNQVVTGLSIVSGTPQSANEAAPFAAPLIVQVNDNTTPVPNITVNFAVTSGPITLSSSSAVTNAEGQAQITATAGSLAGTGIVTASVAGAAPQTFTLTVVPPGPQIISVVNSAGYQNQFVSPCSLATIYGTGLTPGITGVVAAFVEPSTQVAGVTVQFGGISAPILDVANVNGVESVSVQIPCEVPSSAATPPATVPMIVTVDGAPSQEFDVTVLPVSPGIFQFVDSDGATRAVLVSQDGSYIGVTNPARPGDIVRMFVTGLGQTTPALFTNEIDPLVTDSSGDLVPQDLPVNVHLVVGVNNGGTLLVSAKYAYFGVGVYEVDFQVPVNTPLSNNAPFAIGIYEGAKLLFGNPSLIPIQ